MQKYFIFVVGEGCVYGSCGQRTTWKFLSFHISGIKFKSSGWQQVPITYWAILLTGSGFLIYNTHTGTILRLTIGDFTQASITSAGAVMVEEILESKEGNIRVCFSGLFPGVFEHICVFRSSLELELEKIKTFIPICHNAKIFSVGA